MSPSLPYGVQVGAVVLFLVAGRKGQIDFSALVIVPCLSKAMNKYLSPHTQQIGHFLPLIEETLFSARKSHIVGPSRAATR